MLPGLNINNLPGANLIIAIKYQNHCSQVKEKLWNKALMWHFRFCIVFLPRMQPLDLQPYHLLNLFWRDTSRKKSDTFPRKTSYRNPEMNDSLFRWIRHFQYWLEIRILARSVSSSKFRHWRSSVIKGYYKDLVLLAKFQKKVLKYLLKNIKLV